MSNVTILPIVSRLDIPVAKVIEGATDADLQEIVVLGYRRDGSEFFASSQADGSEVLWLLERFKLQLLDQRFQD